MALNGKPVEQGQGIPVKNEDDGGAKVKEEEEMK